MKSKKLIEAWDRMTPNDEADARMLSGILDRSLRRQTGTAPLSASTAFKWASLALCLCLTAAFLIAVPLTANKPDKSGPSAPTDAPSSAQPPDGPDSAQLAADWTLERSIDLAAVIFRGTCLAKTKVPPKLGGDSTYTNYDMTFRVDKVYRGDIAVGDEIAVFSGNLSGGYTEGKDGYILLTVPREGDSGGMYYLVDIRIGDRGGVCDCRLLPDVEGRPYAEIERRIEARVAETGD